MPVKYRLSSGNRQNCFIQLGVVGYRSIVVEVLVVNATMGFIILIPSSPEYKPNIVNGCLYCRPVSNDRNTDVTITMLYVFV